MTRKRIRHNGCSRRLPAFCSALLLLLATAVPSAAADDAILIGVGQSRTVDLAIPWEGLPLPPGTVFTQLLTVAACESDIVEITPPPPVATTTGNITLTLTGRNPGRVTLTPNSLPATNLAITVVRATAVHVDRKCHSELVDYSEWSESLCGATNFWGDAGALAVTVDPPDQPVFLQVNEEVMTVTGSVAIALNDGETLSYAVHLESGPLRNTIELGSVGPIFHSCGPPDASECCGCEDCGSEPGDIGGGCGSAWFEMSLGWADAATADGLLYFHRFSGPLAADPSLLQAFVPRSTGVDYGPDGGVQSVRTGTHVFYVSDEENALRITATNLASGQLVAQCLLSNPDGDPNRLEITGGRLGSERAFGFVWNPAAGAWTFRRGAADDPARVIETVTVSSNAYGNIIEERRIAGANGALVRRTTTEYQIIGGVRLPVREVVHTWEEDNQDFDQTSLSGYGDDPGVPGSYRKLLWCNKADGSWQRFAYDALGRVTTAAAPWLDGAAPAPGNDNPFTFPSSRVVSNDYASLDPSRDDLSLSRKTPRTVSEYIVPVSGPPRLMSRVWRLFAPTNWLGEDAVAEIAERAASASSAFGDPGNPRTVTVSYPARTGDWRSGRTLSVLHPDGRLTTTWYQPGEADPDGTGFIPGGTATHLQTVTIGGTEAHPSGIPGRTAFRAEVSEMKWRRTLLSETYVVNSAAPPTDTAAHALVDWTCHIYDARGHHIASEYADGTAESNVWDCCHRIATVGRDGSERAYGYDSQNRLFRQEDLAIAALPGAGGAHPATDTAYDALGRAVTITRRVLLNGTAAPGYVALTSRTTYNDLAEAETVTVDERGRETTHWDDPLYLYDDTWGDGIPYSWRQSYADGSSARESRDWFGNFGDTLSIWGCLSHGRTWEESVSGDGVLVRRSRAFGRVYDCYYWQELSYSEFVETETLEDTLLGLAVCSGRPGFDGAWVETVNGYDAAGRLASVETWCGAEILSRTLHAYDELGELYRTASDADLDGEIDPGGPDRVTDNHAWYEERPEQTVLGQTVAAGWWRASCSVSYPGDGYSAPLTNSLVLTRLTGLGTVSTNGLLTAETLSFDALGNAAIERGHTDPAALRTTRQSFRSGVAAPATTVALAGRTVSVTAPYGATTTYTYDGFGRVTSESGPRDALKLTGYNAVGELAWTGVASDAATNVTTYGYGWWGDSWSGTYTYEHATDPYGNSSGNDYTANGQIEFSSGNATHSLFYSHDPFGRMTAMATVRDWESWEPDITRWFYDDASGLLTQKLYADGLGTAYDYTPDGKLASRIWARGVATSYTYTNGSSLAAINYSDDTPDVSFQYDRLGRQKVAQTFLSAYHYTYDPVTLALTSETIIDLQTGVTNVISRPHDPLGRPTGISLVGGYGVSYAYDTCGRLATVSNAAFAATYAYEIGGLDAGWTITATNGTIVSRMVTHDRCRNLVTAVSNSVNGAPVGAFAYAHDALGRVISRNGDAFGYNPRSEVTSAAIDTNVYGYAYDGRGNALWSTNNGAGTVYLYAQNLNKCCSKFRIFCNWEYEGNGHGGKQGNMGGLAVGPAWRQRYTMKFHTTGSPAYITKVELNIPYHSELPGEVEIPYGAVKQIFYLSAYIHAGERGSLAELKESGSVQCSAICVEEN